MAMTRRHPVHYVLDIGPNLLDFLGANFMSLKDDIIAKIDELQLAGAAGHDQIKAAITAEHEQVMAAIDALKVTVGETLSEADKAEVFAKFEASKTTIAADHQQVVDAINAVYEPEVPPTPPAPPAPEPTPPTP